MRVDRTNFQPIKASIIRLYRARKELKRVKSEVEQISKEETKNIKNFMFSSLDKEQDSFDVLIDEGEQFYLSPVYLRVTKVTPRKVIWNLKELRNKLKKVMTKFELDQIIGRKYIVNDMPGLIDYLKTCDVDPNVFKQYISVEETLNENKLNNMYETGKLKLTAKELSECYEMQEGESFIKLSEKKQ